MHPIGSVYDTPRTMLVVSVFLTLVTVLLSSVGTVFRPLCLCRDESWDVLLGGLQHVRNKSGINARDLP